MKGDLKMRIKAEWVSNNFANMEMVVDCTDRDDDFVHILYNAITNQLADLMSRKEIKHFIVSIEY